jgi:hypothetical protein
MNDYDRESRAFAHMTNVSGAIQLGYPKHDLT